MSVSIESIMTSRFLRISTAHSLREAMGLLLYGEEKQMDTGAIVVIDPDGMFAGILTPECVVRGLASGVENSGQSSQALVESVNQHLPERIDSVMLRDVPNLEKSSSFSTVVQLIAHGEYECLPVLEEHRVVGLVYATEVLKAAAKLALRPGQDEMSNLF